MPALNARWARQPALSARCAAIPVRTLPEGWQRNFLPRFFLTAGQWRDGDKLGLRKIMHK